MRIQYTNPYRTAQTFLLRTDRPDLLRFEVRAIILSGFSLGVFVKTDGCACRRNGWKFRRVRGGICTCTLRCSRPARWSWSVPAPTPICSLAGQLTTGVWEQMYIFINDSEDRVVECISIQGLWS